MTKMRISDQDLERLIHGDEPGNQELARLAEALQNWQADFTRTPTEEQVSAFASQAAEIALQTKPEVTPQTSQAPSRNRFRTLKYKLATGMAAVLMISGMSGVAVASDAAAPGDALYGLDRALESVGINDGGPTERISEAQALFDAGLIEDALEHATEVFEDDETASGAVSALLDAAERIRTSGDSGNSAQTLTNVAKMLQTMAAAERGPGFGQMISDMAQQINGPDNPGPADQSGQADRGQQENNSQNSGDQGRGNQGNQGNQGPPESPPGQSKGARP